MTLPEDAEQVTAHAVENLLATPDGPLEPGETGYWEVHYQAGANRKGVEPRWFAQRNDAGMIFDYRYAERLDAVGAAMDLAKIGMPARVVKVTITREVHEIFKPTEEGSSDQPREAKE